MDRETLEPLKVNQRVGVIEDGAEVWTVADAIVVSVNEDGTALLFLDDDTAGRYDRVPLRRIYSAREIARLAQATP